MDKKVSPLFIFVTFENVTQSLAKSIFVKSYIRTRMKVPLSVIALISVSFMVSYSFGTHPKKVAIT
jgi:hypothetical protein